MNGGEKLRAWREGRGLTGTQLGEKIGITQGQVSRLEKGLHRPDWKTLDNIIELTNGAVTPNDFADLPECDDPDTDDSPESDALDEPAPRPKRAKAAA